MIIIVVLLGVPRVWYFSCTVDLLHAVLRPLIEIYAAVSKKAVFLFTVVELVQPGGLSSQQMFVV